MSNRRARSVPGKPFAGIIIMAIAALILAFVSSSNGYVLYVSVFVAIYAGLATTLDFVVASTGRIAVCHATFFGIGAYATAAGMLKLGLAFVPAMLLGVAAAAMAALLVGGIATRLGGVYFTLATLGFGIVFVDIVQLEVVKPVTGGIEGLAGVPAIDGLSSNRSYFVLFTALLIVISVAKVAVGRSRVGMQLRAVRDDDELAATLGLNPAGYRLGAFACAGALAGLLGAFFAAFFGYLEPHLFDIFMSFDILVWLLVGGAGTALGPVIGTAVLWAVPQQVDMSPAGTLMIYGAALVLVMLVARQGLVGLGVQAYATIRCRLKRDARSRTSPPTVTRDALDGGSGG